jgi:hypothetical protein
MSPELHTSRHVLETLAADGDPSQAAEARQHVATCAVCSARLTSIRNAGAVYRAVHPADDFARQVAARVERRRHAETVGGTSPEARRAASPGRRRTFAGLFAFAFAMGAVVLLVSRRPDGDQIRLKGAVTWSVFAKRGERTWLAQEGESLRPGDRLAFMYALSDDRYFALLGLDDADTIVPYGPQDGRPLRLARGEGRVPFAVELDARPGEERLFAVFSKVPIDARALERSLAAGAARARREHRWAAAEDLGVRAEIRTFRFTKQQ